MTDKVDFDTAVEIGNLLVQKLRIECGIAVLKTFRENKRLFDELTMEQKISVTTNSIFDALTATATGALLDIVDNDMDRGNLVKASLIVSLIKKIEEIEKQDIKDIFSLPKMHIFS